MVKRTTRVRSLIPHLHVYTSLFLPVFNDYISTGDRSTTVLDLLALNPALDPALNPSLTPTIATPVVKSKPTRKRE